MAILSILRPFGIVYGHLVHFSSFGKLHKEKIWQPCLKLLGMSMAKNFKVALYRPPITATREAESIKKIASAVYKFDDIVLQVRSHRPVIK
jgi:hypothetical protein